MLRVDSLENGYEICQDTDLFCFGIDAVLLAHYCPLKAGDQVMDLGTGNGVIPLIMKGVARDAGIRAHFTGLEIQPASAALARQSVAMNGLEDDIDIAEGDIKEAAARFGAASFSLVTCNPPYMAGGAGLVNESFERMAARHEVLVTLDDVISQGAALLKERGRFGMIHRPHRLTDIIVSMRANRCEVKRLRLVCPKAGKAPTMVLVEAVKGGRPYLTVEPPLIVYGEDGQYTEEVLKIYGKI